MEWAWSSNLCIRSFPFGSKNCAMLKIVPKDFKDHFFLEVISVQCSELCRKLTRILCVFFVLSYCSHGRDSIPSYGANGAIVIWKLHRCLEDVQCKRCWCQQTKIPRLVEQYQWQIFLFLLHHYVNLNWPPSSHNIFVLITEEKLNIKQDWGNPAENRQFVKLRKRDLEAIQGRNHC